MDEDKIAGVLIVLWQELLTLRGLVGLPPSVQTQVDQADGRIVNAIKDLADALKNNV